jgi:hypothetical protein
MTAPRDPTAYRAWLLRCWREVGAGPATPAVWRCSLEDAHTGERRGFADLAAMVAFVDRALAGGHDDERGGNDARPS